MVLHRKQVKIYKAQPLQNYFESNTTGFSDDINIKLTNISNKEFIKNY